MPQSYPILQGNLTAPPLSIRLLAFNLRDGPGARTPLSPRKHPQMLRRGSHDSSPGGFPPLSPGMARAIGRSPDDTRAPRHEVDPTLPSCGLWDPDIVVALKKNIVTESAWGAVPRVLRQQTHTTATTGPRPSQEGKRKAERRVYRPMRCECGQVLLCPPRLSRRAQASVRRTTAQVPVPSGHLGPGGAHCPPGHPPPPGHTRSQTHAGACRRPAGPAGPGH